MATAQIRTQAVEWDDVQGIVLRGYGKHPYSASLLLQVDEAAQARTWLASACDRVTTAGRAKARIDSCYLNMAFTRSGLEKLGLSEKSLEPFPTAFFEGMVSANRTRILGDQGPSAPENWTWGGRGKAVDVMVLIYAKDESTLNQALSAELAGLKGLSPRFDPVMTRLWEDNKEHFGFRDGISQPVIEDSTPSAHADAGGGHDGKYASSNIIKAGEFILGYRNEYNVLPDPLNMPIGSDPNHVLPTVPGGDAPDLGRNGSYLAVRQIAQHVAQLWVHLDEATKDASGASNVNEREKLGAKLIGRWTSGAPIATSPDKDIPARSGQNEFLYRDIDPDGFGCPFGSHIRRANPRDTLGDDPAEALKLSKRHRLIRRGRPFGPRLDDKLDLTDTRQRGTLFMAVNASIERQFEFVQQTWINGPSFNGLYDERDPIFGTFDGVNTGSMTIPSHPLRRKLHGLGGFVTVVGGAYFFLPSIRALRYLATIK